MSETNHTPPGGGDSAAHFYDSRLPPSLAEKHMKLSEFSTCTAAAMAGELDNTVRLLRGHCLTLQSCSERIEGSLLTLGVPTTYGLLSSIATVVEGLEATTSSCKRLSDSHRDEVRQREDLFSALAGAYASLKDRQETTEQELRQIVAMRDRERAAFERVVEYVEAVIAERAAWQAQHGLNAANLPLVEPTFAQRCRETLAACDCVARETGRPDCCVADSAAAVVARWEGAEGARQCTAAPAARLAFVPPLAEVRLLREVLAMGTGSRALLHDVREERRALDEARGRAREMGAAVALALQRAKADLEGMREWLGGLERRGQPFLSGVDEFRNAVRGEMQRLQQQQQLGAQANEPAQESMPLIKVEEEKEVKEEEEEEVVPQAFLEGPFATEEM